MMSEHRDHPDYANEASVLEHSPKTEVVVERMRVRRDEYRLNPGEVISCGKDILRVEADGSHRKIDEIK